MHGDNFTIGSSSVLLSPSTSHSLLPSLPPLPLSFPSLFFYSLFLPPLLISFSVPFSPLSSSCLLSLSPLPLPPLLLGMVQNDRNAALRARHRVRATTVRSRRRDRQAGGVARRDTDDETNESMIFVVTPSVMSAVHVHVHAL